MLSGGGDSVALLNAAVEAKGSRQTEALHVNYGLRSDAALDQLHCEQLCERLGVALHVRAVELPGTGNMHANARTERYRLAREIAATRGIESIATAHTADDQAETVLYRLVSSPGRRALRGIAARDGNLIRPLLDVRRSELRAYLAERGLAWREDSSNADPRFARTRVRRVVRELEDVHPAAVANVNATAGLMRVEEDAVRELVLEKLEALRAPDGSLAVDELAALHTAVAALALRELAEAAADRAVPVAPSRVAELLELAARGGSRRLDLGAGATAEVAYGRLRVFADDGEMVAGGPRAGRTPLALPGTEFFHGWRISAEPVDGGLEVSGAAWRAQEAPDAVQGSAAVQPPTAARPPAVFESPAVAAAAPPFEIELHLTPSAARELYVRVRRQGDRLRPKGLDGSKSLQDVFVDRKVPRAQRDAYPVVCSGDEILWVPGLVVGEALGGLPEGNTGVVTARLCASPPPPAVGLPGPQID